MIQSRRRLLCLTRRAGLLFLLALLAALTLLGRSLAPARAAFPGFNGKIVFTSNRDGNDEIYVMNADGSNQTRLTNNTALDDAAAWSPDGTKIAFHSNRDGNQEVYVMNADGSNQTRLTNNLAFDFEPGWSPDGTQIVFASSRDGDNEIYVMNADGSGQTPLTGNTAGDGQPVWSPDGLKIAFISDRDLNYEVYVMNSDGSGQANLSNNAAHDYWPAWSPDGMQIAFNTSRDIDFEIYAMNSDGSGQTNLSNNNLGDDLHPAWSPDGTRIAFESSRDGNNEIYVMNADGSGQTRLTNGLASDFAPDWQPAAQLTITKATSPAGGTGFPFTFDPAAVTFLHKWGSLGPGQGQFNSPSHVAVDEAGNVYVAEIANNRVQKFDNSGAFVAAWGYDVIAGNGVTTFEVCGPADTCKAGTSGSGPGQFNNPDGIAARGGVVYVVEATGNRVQKFSDTGVYLGSWGGGGDAAGQFADPEGVAIDAAGNVYVADNFNHRVQKFDAGGNFLLAWGWDVVAGNGVTTFEVCTPSDTCQSGAVGGGKGQFDTLTGMAVHGDNVYVTEPYNRRVQKFDGDGNFILTWGYDVVTGGGAGFEICGPADICKAGISGSGRGQFNFATDVAADMTGNVYVGDLFNNRVQKFTAGGVFLAQIGSAGSGDGQFANPNGVAVDGAGHIFVSDGNNSRIQKFGQTTVLLDDGQSHTYDGVQPGVVVVGELVPDGWTLDDIDCDGGNPAENGAAVSLTLAAGDDVTCTFTNLGPPQLTIVKSVTGSGAPANWSFGFSSTLGTFGLTNGNPDVTSGELAANDLVPGAFTVSEANPPGYATSASCDNGESATDGNLSVTLATGDDVECTFSNTICQPGYYDTTTGWDCIPADPGYFVDTVGAAQQTPCPPGYFQEYPDSSSCDAADPGYYATGPAATEQTACPVGMTSPPSSDSIDDCVPVSSTAVFVSATTAGTTADGQPFGPEDVLLWDGSAWSLWFDGSAAGLMPVGKYKHNINAFWIPDPDGDDVVMSFAQNGRPVPGIAPKVDGMDLVYWDGSSFSLWFDGSDVGLTQKTAEKIDGLHVLPGTLSPIGGGSCEAYLLISTQGPGKVTNYSGGTLNFSGEDVLGFCATNLGDTTTGLWHMVLDGSQQGMPKNSTDSISYDAGSETLYLTTKSTFNVGGASGGHSAVYAYDMTTQTFSGPLFVAAAAGLPAKVDGLQYEVTP